MFVRPELTTSAAWWTIDANLPNILSSACRQSQQTTELHLRPRRQYRARALTVSLHQYQVPGYAVGNSRIFFSGDTPSSMLSLVCFLPWIYVASSITKECSEPPLDVKFDGTYQVVCGKSLELTATQSQPTVTWDEASKVTWCCQFNFKAKTITWRPIHDYRMQPTLWWW